MSRGGYRVIPGAARVLLERAGKVVCCLTGCATLLDVRQQLGLCEAAPLRIETRAPGGALHYRVVGTQERFIVRPKGGRFGD